VTWNRVGYDAKGKGYRYGGVWFRFVDVPVEDEESGGSGSHGELGVRNATDNASDSNTKRGESDGGRRGDEDERGQLVLERKMLPVIVRGGRSRPFRFQVERLSRPSNRDDGAMHVCSH
jgi:hypothetical protein